MNEEFFKGIVQWEFSWEGRTGKIPVFYYDHTALTAIYTASTARVRRVLPHLEMHPVELYPGRCLVAFTALEYRRTDIDPYNELSVSILITFGKKPRPVVTLAASLLQRRYTAYILQLPVTTEVARAGGVDQYGYPKFLANITFDKQKDWVTCELVEKKTKILSLKGKVLHTHKGKVARYVTYSMKDGIPLVANIYMNPLEYAETPNPRAAALEIGSGHPICDQLKGLDLGKRPVVYQYSPASQAILFAPRNLIDD